MDSSNLGRNVQKAVDQLNREYENPFRLQILPFSSIVNPIIREEQLDKIRSSQLVLVDVRGSNPAVEEVTKAIRQGKATAVSLIGGEPRVMSLTKIGLFDGYKFFSGPRAAAMGGAEVDGDFDFDSIDQMLKDKLPGFIYRDIGAWFEVTRYWQINGLENVKRMLILLLRNYCGAKYLPKPLLHVSELSPAIRHPNTEKIYESLEEYLKDYKEGRVSEHRYDESLPTVVIVFYDGMHYESSKVPAYEYVKRLEKEANVVAIACDGIKNIQALQKLGFMDGKFIGDAIIHLTHFRLNGGPLGGKAQRTTELLKACNVPIYHPVAVFNSSETELNEGGRGLKPVDYMSHVTLPELDGSLEPLLCCALKEGDCSCSGDIVALTERIDRSCSRILKNIKLRRMKNSEKKLALILYNYPPGEHNLANAAYLDSFKSLKNILLALKDAGYMVENIPENAAEAFLSLNVVNSPQWKEGIHGEYIDKTEYDRLLAPYPKLKADIDEEFGAFPGKVNADAEGVYLPCLNCGNISVMLQPSRGIHEDPEKAYHDKNLPPHHQYAAFYLYLQQNEDAIVHIGTHGTLEFLRGRELAITKDCDMDMLLGNIPHYYIYQIANPSEAMIAKRRSLASTVGYLSPAADSSGLYGEFLRMAELFDERSEALNSDPTRVSVIEKEIRQAASRQQWDDLDGDLRKIEKRLTEMQRSFIPIGLHSFGELPEEEENCALLASVLRMERPDVPSLNSAIAEDLGLDYEKLLKRGGRELIKIDAEAKTIIKGWLAGNEDGKYSEQRKLAAEILENIKKSDEIGALLNALSGGYTQPGLAGDGLKNPEVFPSGRNLYQFDPLSLPTPSAVERGRKIALSCLESFYKEKGRYPEMTGVILWGFETAKTAGETIGQIFEYLGVELISKPGAWFAELRLIPLEKLNHPRVDVSIQICGFFRDMFPNLMDELDKALKMAAEAEKDNPISRRSEEIKEQLLAQGVDRERAQMLSNARIFGPKPGEYGTSLTSLIETSVWQEERELGEAYTRDMDYVYTDGAYGEAAPTLCKSLTAEVEMISQIQDCYEYEVTDLDHYYEFYGGFAKAIENIRGEKPEMLAVNTSTELIKTEDIKTAVLRGVNTRNFNPRWIDAMLEHDYHGAQQIADRVQYQIGLSATTGAVSNETWEKTAQTYLFDEDMLRRLKENNLHAAQEIADRVYESSQRGYWQPQKEELEELMRIMLEMNEELES